VNEETVAIYYNSRYLFGETGKQIIPMESVQIRKLSLGQGLRELDTQKKQNSGTPQPLIQARILWL
jgi:hypothetical protein